MTEISDRLPAVTVQDSAGNAIALGDLKAPLILYFYPKADTPGCTNEAKDFTELAGDFAKAGVAVYGMSKDKPAKLARFAEKYGLKVALLSDAESDAIEQMGVWVEKTLYGKKYMGIERCTFLLGGDGKVVRVWRKVKVKGHAAEVLEAAQGL